MDTDTRTVADRLVDAITRGDWVAVTECYAPDALLDINLPTWRFQLQGPDAAASFFGEAIGQMRNPRCTEYRVYDAGNTLVIEEEGRFEQDDGEYLWRACNVFHLEDDQVTEHTQYCTGCWTPADIARQAKEAPMIRWFATR